MKKIFLFIPLFFYGMEIFAQKPAMSAFAELGGPGLASVNFDMRVKGEKGLGFRAGIGGFSIKEEYSYAGSSSEKITLLAIPLAVNYLIGNDGLHYFEIGAGYTPVILKDKTRDQYGTDNDEFRSSFGHLHFGYRRQPSKNGFTFRAGITPVFGNGYFIPYYASISFGYKF